MKVPLPRSFHAWRLAALAVLAVAWALPAAAVSFVSWERVRTFQEVLEFDGQTRYVSYLAPANPQPGAPAVFLLPYNGGSAPAMANLTEAGQLVRDHGVWVIMPVAVRGTWAHNPQRPGLPDDVGFLAHVIDRAVAQYGIDPHRVYMTGYSAGGNMSVRFACERPEKIAAAANVAATMRESLASVCTPAVAMPMAFMQGTADDQVEYDPDSVELTDVVLRSAMSAPAAAAFWAGINGCGATPVRRELPDRVDDGTHVSVDQYGGCAAGAAVELFTVHEGGHAWPGALDFVPRVGLTTQDIVGIQELWSFFQQFRRP